MVKCMSLQSLNYYSTWTAIVDRCSKLFQTREASLRLSERCGQSWPRLCLVEASLTSPVPLQKNKQKTTTFNYTTTDTVSGV